MIGPLPLIQFVEQNHNMATRNRIYYPLSHIVTNLYTAGKEWMLKDGTEYIGFYHRYIDGNIMSEAVFNRATSVNLIRYIDQVKQPENLLYNRLAKRVRYSVKDPYQVYPVPTEKDFKAGKITRYFLRRRNLTTFEDIYEVNRPQYISWKKPKDGIDETLYSGLELSWKITGPLNDIGVSPNIEYGVYDTNKRMVQLKNREFPGLLYFLTDYTELTIYSAYINDKLKEMFGTK